MAARLPSSRKLIEHKVLSEWCSEQSHLFLCSVDIASRPGQSFDQELDLGSPVNDRTDERPSEVSAFDDDASRSTSESGKSLHVRARLARSKVNSHWPCSYHATRTAFWTQSES
jgi:hypothetical protein